MNIDHVYVRGLRDLYEHYAKIYAVESVQRQIETYNRKNFAEYLEVSFVFSEVSPMDFYYLQKYTGGNSMLLSGKESPVKEVTMHGNEDQERLFTELTDCISSLKHQIEQDADAGPELIDSIKFPKCSSCTCITTIRGFQILNICQVNSIFELLVVWLNDVVKTSKPNEVEKYRFPLPEEIFDKEMSMYKPKVSFEDLISEKFVNGYANFIYQNLNQTDYVVDSFVHKKEFAYLDSNQVVLDKIISPITEIDMTGRTLSTDMMGEIQKIRDAKETFLKGQDNAKLFRIRITVRSSLHSFLSLVMATNYSLLKNVEDLRLLVSRPFNLFSIQGAKAYELRIKGLHQRYQNFLRTFMQIDPKRKENIYAPNILNFIPNWVPVCYTLEGTLEDFVWTRMQLDQFGISELDRKEFGMIRDSLERFTKSVFATFPSES